MPDDSTSSYPSSGDPAESSAANSPGTAGAPGIDETPDQGESSSPFSAGWITGLAAVVILIGIFVVPRLLSSDEAGEAAPDEPDQAPRVSGYVVEPQSVSDRLFTTGSLRANEEVELVSETSGRITQILFGEGTRVERGQMLLTINDAELQAELERLQYELELAEQREQRQAQLLERGGISREEYEDVENQVNMLRSEKRLLEARIDKARVRAPFSGTIGLRHVSEGSFLSQQDRIATLRSINPIKIDFSVPERYAGSVSTGDEISFRVEGVDEEFQGTIYAIEPGISASTRALQLRAESANPDARLLPGLFANIELQFDQVDDAIVVPALAVLAEQEGSQVLVKENGEVARRTVQTGIRTDSTVQILSGLTMQDTVITSGFQQLQPGDRVEIEGLEDLPEEEGLQDLPEPEGEPQQQELPATEVSGG